jgi:hypothetical protein
MHSSFDPLFTPMANARITRGQRGVLAAALVACCFGAGVSAQDTVPATPPELKDFRLDKPPPREKEPAATPPVAAPAPQAKVEPPKVAPAPQRQAERPRPQSAPGNTKPAAAPVPDGPVPSETVLDDAVPGTMTGPVPPISEALPAAPAADVTAPPTTTNQPFDIMAYWPALAALLAAIAGWIAFGLWKRRVLAPPEAEVSAEGFAEPQFSPEPALTPSPSPSISPAPNSTNLTASFEPSDARLSLTNLTITGRLRLRHDGAEPLETLKLRTLVLSACDGQAALIEDFHRNADAGHIESLGHVAPGEEIDLMLELQVPRASLQAFDWRERRFVAPIVLINLDSGKGRQSACEISNVVGLQGDPLSPRMRPLPIDRGPRLFEALRFRPIAA